MRQPTTHMRQFDPLLCRRLDAIGIIGGSADEKQHIIQHIQTVKKLQNGSVVKDLATFIQEQHELVKKERTAQSRRFCVITEATNSQEFVNLIRNTSYLHATVFLPFDEIADMPPYIRVNIDCVFVSKNIDTTLKKKVYESFAGMFEDFAAFDSALSNCNGWMVLYFGNPSNKMEDIVFKHT